MPEPARRALLLAAADDSGGGAALRALPLAGLGVAELAAAEASGLLWLDGERLAFRHPLVRSAAYGQAPFEDRRRAHTALADALSGPADADRRAWHRAASVAAPDDDVATELAESAERGGHAAAAAALERAAGLTSDEPLRAPRLVGAAEAARLAGEADHAIELAGDGLALAADPGTAAATTAIRGAILAHRGDPGAAAADLRDAACALAASQPRRALRGALLAGESAALAGQHEHSEELARWAASLPVGEADADRALVAFMEGLAALFGGELAEAAVRFERGVELAATRRCSPGRGWARSSAATSSEAGAPSRRRWPWRASWARLRASPLPLQFLALLETVEGRFALATTDAADGFALAQESGEEGATANCRGVLAWNAAVRGREDDCRALAADALEWAAAQSARVAAESAQRALAVNDLGAGRHEAAFDRLSAIVTEARIHPGRRCLMIGDLVEAATGCGREAEARRPLADLTAWGTATGSAWAAATLGGAGVQLATDADAAEAAYVRAMEATARIELRFDRARMELRLGEHMRRARRRVQARRHLRAALDLFAEAGAAPWEARAAAELRATGEVAPQARSEHARRPDAAGAADRAHGGGGRDEPGSRRSAVPQHANGRLPPGKGVLEAQRAG